MRWKCSGLCIQIRTILFLMTRGRRREGCRPTDATRAPAPIPAASSLGIFRALSKLEQGQRTEISFQICFNVDISDQKRDSVARITVDILLPLDYPHVAPKLSCR